MVFAPFCPEASSTMQSMLGIPQTTGAPTSSTLGLDTWSMASEHLLAPGSPLGEPVILFTKVENDIVEREITKLGQAEAATSNQPQATVEQDANAGLITIDQFGAVKLRTAIVVEAERVPKSEKLLKLQVDLGGERRQILAGIAKHYAPEDVVGKTIVVVANLKPAKLMGMESQGMVLAASNADGKLTLVSPLDVHVGPGAEVR